MIKRLLVLFTALAGMSLITELLCAADAPGKLVLPKIYGDGMVLQREVPVRIVGKARPEARIDGELNGQKSLAIVDSKGEFVLEFTAMKAGGPYSLVLRSGPEETVTFKDVLIGEVWFCSGQSNMALPTIQCEPFCRMTPQEFMNAVTPDSNLRLFQTERALSPGFPKWDLAENSRWRISDANSVRNFSGYAYFFGENLREKLNVPVGLVNSSWGGTAIQSWIPDDAYFAAGREKEMSVIRLGRAYSEALAEGREPEAVKAQREWVQKYYAYNPDATKSAAGWKSEDLDDSDWEKGTKLKRPGIGWFRNTVEVPAELAGKELHIYLYVVINREETFFNGEKIGSYSLEKPSPVSSYMIPGRLVKPGKNLIAVRLSWFSGQGGGLWGNGEKFFIQARGASPLKLSDNWKVRQEFSIPQNELTPAPLGKDFMESAGVPGTLFNGMVNPWTKVPVRGVLWYQGCSNMQDPEDYFNLHKIWLKAWRDAWKQQDMPVIITQLAGYIRDTPDNPLPDDYWKSLSPSAASGVAAICEVQEAMLRFPKVGCVVSNDFGDQSNIHPKRKSELGRRAAMESMRLAYGYSGVTAGPRFKNMASENGKLRIFFSNAVGGLTTSKGDAPGNFAVAGGDGRFYWANAVLDGDSVVLSSQKVPAPVHARYAWENFAGNPNLRNREGFTAFPFRTDRPEYLIMEK